MSEKSPKPKAFSRFVAAFSRGASIPPPKRLRYVRHPKNDRRAWYALAGGLFATRRLGHASRQRLERNVNGTSAPRKRRLHASLQLQWKKRQDTRSKLDVQRRHALRHDVRRRRGRWRNCI